MYYASPELIDSKLPVHASAIGSLHDPSRPEIEIALLELERATDNLPQLIAVAPRSGFDLKFRSAEDVVHVYAFDGSAFRVGQHCSLADMLQKGVLDWGALTPTLQQAHKLQAQR